MHLRIWVIGGRYCLIIITGAGFYNLNIVKAHLQTYPYINILFASCTRFFTLGILFSANITIILLFLYSLRECYQSIQSGIATCCMVIILSEALLFITYFWGGFHFSWVSLTEGIITPSARGLIMVITLLLSTASIFTGYIQCLKQKQIGSSQVVLVLMLLCSGFIMLQISEFNNLQFYINDSMLGCTAVMLTGLHFSHVVIGLVLLVIYFWDRPLQYQANNIWYGYHQSSYIVLAHNDSYIQLYWHFVEILWLFIQFVVYSE